MELEIIAEMSLIPGSAKLSNDQFLQGAISGSLNPAEFRHADHLRLGWLAVDRWPLDVAEEFARESIQRIANRHGAGRLYHETITTAWIRLIASHHEETFAEFLTLNEHRLTKELLYRFRTPGRLWSDEARRNWLIPDRAPLPPPAKR